MWNLPSYLQHENTDFSRTFWETTWARFEPDYGFYSARRRQARIDQLRYDEMACRLEWERQARQPLELQLHWLQRDMRGVLSPLIALIWHRDYDRLRRGNRLGPFERRFLASRINVPYLDEHDMIGPFEQGILPAELVLNTTHCPLLHPLQLQPVCSAFQQLQRGDYLWIRFTDHHTDHAPSDWMLFRVYSPGQQGWLIASYTNFWIEMEEVWRALSRGTCHYGHLDASLYDVAPY